MAAIWGAAISAGAGILGNIMNQSGAQQTNAMNMAMMMQNEQWQERMSDTQMQRRVQDLQSAGLNPMLAVNTPGAAMPGFQQPQLQNPGAAWGELGQQMASAMQLNTQGAQIRQLNAAADAATADAEYKRGPQSTLAGEQAGQARAQAELARSTSDLLVPAQAGQARAAQALGEAQTERLDQQIRSGDIAAQVKLLGAQTTAAGAQAQLYKIDALLDNYSAIEKRYIMPFVIRDAGVQLQLSMLKVPEANATATYFSQWAGQHLRLQQQIESGIHTAADVFDSLNPLRGPGRASRSSGATFGNPDTVTGAPNMER